MGRLQSNIFVIGSSTLWFLRTLFIGSTEIPLKYHIIYRDYIVNINHFAIVKLTKLKKII